MKKILFTAAAVLLAGCHSVSEDETAGVIAVATTHPTRGTLVASDAEMTDFGLFCTYTAATDWTSADQANIIVDEQMIKSGSPSGHYNYWTYASGNPVHWNAATADDRYTFFAYAPFASNDNGVTVTVVAGIPYLIYTVPTDTSLQPDLMVAEPRYNVRPTGNPVQMHMVHALTAVGFQIFGNGEQVSSISLTGFSAGAELVMDGTSITWSNLLAPTTTLYPAGLNLDENGVYTTGADGDTRPVTADNGWLMMIPQTLTAAASATVTFADGTPDITIPLDQRAWTAGQRVLYKITVR